MGKLSVTDRFQAQAGVYDVRFAGFSSRDEQGPVARATDFGMRVYMNFEIASGQESGESVPCGCDPDDGLAGWCFVFSGKPPQSNDLLAIEKQMKTSKVVKVLVNDKGWVQGVFVPKGTYLAKFVRFSNRDEATGAPTWVSKEFNGEERKMVYWQFEVVAGDLVGVRIPGSCRYAIKRTGDDMELSNRSSMYSWLVACGVVFEKLPEFKDPDNLLPEFEAMMQRAGVLLSIQVGDNGWVSGGQTAIAPAPQGVSVVSPARPAVGPSEKPMAELYTLAKLLALIGEKAEALGFDGAVADGALTDAGKKFAAQYIAPFCAERGIPRSFKAMSAANIQELMGHLEGLKADEF